ncbi:hypothetical protein AJ79_03821 [Helicocarpus griseus UAMH5409]|uniref:Anaphase-promoting complex subunit CDC26 n=1 Tax=Helicocarpus griseus UAMH5409 TaxID=1447875 RepID=A0A2B7XMW6_9EURO|nr:hypothetical protein AJ79_03821 [Helicocarpus griseus UAMH5409]
MLRRKPTAITITTEDIIAFEEERARQQQQLKENNQQPNNSANSRNSSSSFGGVTYDPNDELKPLPGDKARIVRTRDERIGLGRTG